MVSAEWRSQGAGLFRMGLVSSRGASEDVRWELQGVSDVAREPCASTPFSDPTSPWDGPTELAELLKAVAEGGGTLGTAAARGVWLPRRRGDWALGVSGATQAEILEPLTSAGMQAFRW